jgi:hypothetical protein
MKKRKEKITLWQTTKQIGALLSILLLCLVTLLVYFVSCIILKLAAAVKIGMLWIFTNTKKIEHPYYFTNFMYSFLVFCEEKIIRKLDKAFIEEEEPAKTISTDKCFLVTAGTLSSEDVRPIAYIFAENRNKARYIGYKIDENCAEYKGIHAYRCEALDDKRYSDEVCLQRPSHGFESLLDCINSKEDKTEEYCVLGFFKNLDFLFELGLASGDKEEPFVYAKPQKNQ